VGFFGGQVGFAWNAFGFGLLDNVAVGGGVAPLFDGWEACDSGAGYRDLWVGKA
jgi:hypothetical protein